ncbi:MAG: SH3 domain-containing protein [Anaerolineae bacterium]|nr:SH3 domain-containing protein [Anaerolineae bacterium]MDW8173534.1 SH3 domain-containing protein [Anaerolineae bacterium]
MSKRIRLGLLLALLALAAMAIPTSAQQRCNGDTSEGTIIDGTVNCRVISGRDEGLARDREARIIRAVDIFDPSGWTSPRVGLCLRGTGALMRIPTGPGQARQALWTPPVQGAAGHTCVVIDSPSIVILLDEPYPPEVSASAPGPAATPGAGGATTKAPAPVDGSATTGTAPRFTLEGCTVVTTAILNFRSGPSLSAPIKGLVPFNIALRAIDRQGDWYNVIYESDNGWITATRVRTRGNCGAR